MSPVPSPSRRVALAGAIGAALLVAAPAAAHASGFSAPRAISPTGAVADEPLVAVAPNGRTAVVWFQRDRRFRNGHYVAAIGRGPGSLRRAARVRAATRVADAADEPVLQALPGGGFALCLSRTASRRRTSVGCTFASATGRFGAFRVVATRPSRERPSLLAAPRPDGSLATVAVRRVGSRTRALRSAVLPPSGRLLGAHDLATIRGSADDPIDLATAEDGATAVAWTLPIGSSLSVDRTPVLRLMAPGADRFGPPVAFGAPSTIFSSVGLEGGRDLLVRYAGGDRSQVVRRRPDGAFDAPLGLPRLAGEDADGGVVQLADGSPFAVVATGRQSGSDCGALVRGAVGAGPLSAAGSTAVATRLSAPRQIAHDPVAGTLRDGTVVAVWGDSDGDASRVEVAVRAPGASAFGAARPLPRLAARSYALATGGDQAVLAWLTGDRLEGPAHVVVSHLRRSAPYAATAPRPRRPSAPCS